MQQQITVNGIITEVNFTDDRLREIHIGDVQGREYAIVNEYKDCTIIEKYLELQDIHTIYEIANNFEKYFSEYLNGSKRFLLINAYVENAFTKDYSFFLTAGYYPESDKSLIAELYVNQAYHIENSEMYILRIK